MDKTNYKGLGVTQARIVVFLHNRKEFAYSVVDIARTIAMRPSCVRKALIRLHARGIVLRTTDKKPRYQISPFSKHFDDTIAPVLQQNDETVPLSSENKN